MESQGKLLPTLEWTDRPSWPPTTRLTALTDPPDLRRLNWLHWPTSWPPRTQLTEQTDPTDIWRLNWQLTDPPDPWRPDWLHWANSWHPTTRLIALTDILTADNSTDCTDRPPDLQRLNRLHWPISDDLTVLRQPTSWPPTTRLTALTDLLTTDHSTDWTDRPHNLRRLDSTPQPGLWTEEIN